MPHPLRIGLLRLADSAPILAADTHGFFRENTILPSVSVEPSWANLADKMTWGVLDAAVMFPPLAFMTMAGTRGRPVQGRLTHALSRGGNMVVLRKLDDAPNPTITTLNDKKIVFSKWAAKITRKPKFAVVHENSTHYLILRRLLNALSVSFDHAVDLVIMPPDQIVTALTKGAIDGFCAGPPWGTEACLSGAGFCLARSTDILPNHLEKCLFVTDRWLNADKQHLAGLTSALSKAALYCSTPENSIALTDLLARPLKEGGLNLPYAATRSLMPDNALPDGLHFPLDQTIKHTDLQWMIDDMKTLGWLTAFPDHCTA